MKITDKMMNLQMQNKTVSREANTKFRDMMQAIEAGREANGTRKDINKEMSRDAKGKETEVKDDDLKTDKEAESKDATVKDDKLDKEVKSKDAKDREVVVKDDKTGKEDILVSKDAIIKDDKLDREVKSKDADKEVVVKDDKLHKEEEIKDENLDREVVPIVTGWQMAQSQMTQGSERKDAAAKHEQIASDTDLQKKLDNALMLKPEIKAISKEASISDLKKDIKAATGKEVEITFEKEFKKEIYQPIISPQGSEIPEMEKIYIKVAEPEQLAPKLVEELNEKIQIIQTDEKSYEIELDPKNLGKILVKVSLNKGETALEMHFSSKKTMELMERQIEHLSENIQGGKTTNINVQLAEQGSDDYLQQQGGEGQGRQRNNQKQEQRKSDEFIHQMKQSLKEQGFAIG